MSLADRADVSIARDYAALIGGSQGAPGNQLQGAESIRLCARSAELLPEVLAALRDIVEGYDGKISDGEDPLLTRSQRLRLSIEGRARAALAKVEGQS